VRMSALRWCFGFLACHLQPDLDVDITTGDLRRAEEDVSTVATSAVHSYRVLSAVCSGAVKGDLAALAAVWRICRPRGSIQSILESLIDLREGGRKEGEGEKSNFAEHFCGWRVVEKAERWTRRRFSYLCALSS
jgi:hypothetical protein